MRIFNGHVYSDMTMEELSDIQTEAKKAAAIERHRPLYEHEVLSLLLRQQINTICVDDQTALRMLAYYPEWATGQSYTDGCKIQHNGNLCRCIQSHTSQSGWEPENTPNLWEVIHETYAGDIYDPIPYSGNMALTEGLYYTQNHTLYLCVRSTEHPVYHTLHELTDLYVTVIQ